LTNTNSSPSSEAEFLAALKKINRRLAPTFVFGCYDVADIEQQAAVFALEALPKYDPGGFDEDGNPRRRLDNFLFIHVRNRLINFYRDKCHRNDPPCARCHGGEPCADADGKACPKYEAWQKRNRAKADIMRPVGLSLVGEEQEPRRRPEDSPELSEAKLLIDRRLPTELRPDYLRMLAGERLSPPRRRHVEEAVREILKEYGEVEAEAA
jgi:DNA-directed RNA polymerase specialized sigma24 family protein